jgi:hypothetical protein
MSMKGMDLTVQWGRPRYDVFSRIWNDKELRMHRKRLKNIKSHVDCSLSEKPQHLRRNPKKLALIRGALLHLFSRSFSLPRSLYADAQSASSKSTRRTAICSFASPKS